MKSSAKPSGGCGRAGFVYVDRDGGLVQVYWEDLTMRGEALFAFDGVTWYRVRDINRLSFFPTPYRLSIAPVDASQDEITALACTVPGSLMLGDGAAQLDRARRLLEFPPELLQVSNAWRDLSPLERSAFIALGDTATELSDVELLQALETAFAGDPEFAKVIEEDKALRIFAEVRHRIPGVSRLAGIPELRAAMLAQQVLPEYITAYCSASHLEGSDLEEDLRLLLTIAARNLDHADPFAVALAEVYRMPVTNSTEMLNALSFLSAGLPDVAIASEVAARVEREVPEDLRYRAAGLLRLSLMRSGGSTEQVDAVLADLLADPGAAMRRHGSPQMLVEDALPRLSGPECAAMLELLGLSSIAPLDDETIDLIGQFKPDLYERVRRLVTNEIGAEHPGNTDFVVRAIATFGDRAPDWLLAASRGSAVNRARLLERLPDADTAFRRCQQLEEVANAPAPTAAAVATAVAEAELLGSLTVQLRDRERGLFLSGLVTSIRSGDLSATTKSLRSISDHAELLALLADADGIRVRADDLERTVADLEPEAAAAVAGNVRLLRSLSASLAAGEDPSVAAGWARKFLAGGGDPTVVLTGDTTGLESRGRDLLGPADSVPTALWAPLAAEPALLASLLPSASAAIKRAKALDGGAQSPAARREFEFLSEYARLLKTGDATAANEFARTALTDPLLADRLLPPAKVVAQQLAERKPLLETEEERDARISGVRRDLELWKRYSEAMLTGDEARLMEVGAEIFPDKTLDRVSVHDALFFLPADPRRCVAPDGSRLGDWLLNTDRGLSALRTETGRRSLGLAAVAWSTSGSSDALIKNLADDVVTREFGGHRDDLSLFFVRSKISRDSAERSLAAMRSSREVPTLLPLDEVWEDQATGLRGYFLPRTDPRGIQAGVFTDCCQHPDSAGASCAFAGQSHPSSGFFIVEDAAGEIIAQSWVWAADGGNGSSSGVIFDNVEARLGTADASRVAAVRGVYDSAADALAGRFDRVLIGAHNDIPTGDLPPIDPAENLVAGTIGYSGYLGDSRSQRLYRTGTNAGPRYRGLTDGFLIESGDSSVRVHTDGRVELHGPAARELAETELASSTRRVYRIADAAGEPTGEELLAGSASQHAVEFDLTAAPDSYVKFSDELVSRVSGLAGVAAEEAAHWLELASGDPEKAATAARSAFTMGEYSQLRHSSDRIGRLPMLPPHIAALDPDDRKRQTFVGAWTSSPLLAEQALGSPQVLELLEATASAAVSGAASKVALAESLHLLTAGRPNRSQIVSNALMLISEAQDAGFSIAGDVAGVVLALDEADRLGLDPFDLRTLAKIGPRSGDVLSGKRGPALLDGGESIQRIAELDETQLRELPYAIEALPAVSRRNTPVDVAISLTAASIPARFAAVQVDGDNPLRGLEILQTVVTGEEAWIPELREIPAERPEPGSFEESEFLRSIATAMAPKVRAARHILEPGLRAETSTDELLELAALDIDAVVEKASSAGVQRQYGEHMPPFLFTPEGMRRVADASEEEIEELRQVVDLHDRAPSRLPVALEIGLTSEHLVALSGTAAEPRPVDADALHRAVVDRGVPVEEVRRLALSGVSWDLFHTALASAPVHEALTAGSDREVLEAVARWGCHAKSRSLSRTGPFEGAKDSTVSWLIDAAARGPEARAAVLEMLAENPVYLDGSVEEDDFFAPRPPQFKQLRDIFAGLESALGGFGVIGGVAKQSYTV